MKDLLNGSSLLLKLSPGRNNKLTTDEAASISSPLLTSSPTTLLSPSLPTSPTSTISSGNNKKRSSYMSAIIPTNTTRGRNTTMTSTTVANMMTTAATATTKQPIIIEKLLPDELITHILMYLHSDLKTLCTMAEISLRLRRVAMQVIRLYFLPNIRLSTFIDQEGRRKSTMQYVFDSLDDTTLEIQFKPMSISPQRYRNDNYAASPTLHRLSMSDANNYSASALSWPLYTFTTTDPNEEGENTTSDDDKNNSRRQPSWHTLDSITSNTLPSSPTNMSEFMNNKMIETTTGKRKQLQITKPGIFSSSTSSNGNSGSSLWQLEYRVSTDHHSASMSAVTVFDNQNVNEGGNERFVTPLYVKTHLSMFSKAQSSGKIYKRLSLNGKENNSNSKSILQWFKKRS